MLRRAWTAWSRFWFEPRDLSGMILARTLLGAVVIYWSLSNVFGIDDFFGPNGFDPDPHQPWYHLSLSRVLPASVAPWIITAILVLGGVTLITGRFVVVGAPLTWLGIISLYHENRLIWNGGDDLLRLLALYFALFSIFEVPRVASMPPDAVWRGRRPRGAPWPVRLVQIQLAVVYFSTAFEKLRGDTWADGTATLRAFGLRNMHRFWAPDFVYSNVWLANVMTWGSIVLEVTIPFALFSKRWRRPAIVVGIAFHLSIEYLLRVGIFSWVMIVAYLTFLSADDIARLALWWRNAISHRHRDHRHDDRPAVHGQAGGLSVPQDATS